MTFIPVVFISHLNLKICCLMMNKKLKIISYVVLCAAMCLFIIVASAHSGKTDSYGGHYDNSSGEYHYHHGYSAHQHEDIDGDGIVDCPFDFDDKTNHNDSYNNDTVSDNTQNMVQSNKLSFGDIILIVFKIIGISSLILVLGCSVLYLIFHLFLNRFIILFCNKILKKDISESTCNKISIVSSIVVATTIVSIIVLSNEGII